MSRPVVLLGRPESPLAARIAARLAAADIPALCLDLDAPLNGEPVTVRDDHITWQGCDLAAAAALWCEAPVFPWPQMVPPPCPLPDAENFERWRHYQREARALAVGALAAACDVVPAINAPSAAHLAITPTVALDRLAAAGLPVAPWRVAGDDARSDEITIDATGADHWHRPAGAPADGPRLHITASGAVTALLVIAGEIVAAQHWDAAAAWAAGAPGACVDAAQLAAPLRARAEQAAAALAADIVQLACDTDAILRADAAPDLLNWDDLTDHTVAAALARRLAALAGAAL